MSVKLAQAFSGEVINADAYQLYKGLTIATAKITEDEVFQWHIYACDISLHLVFFVIISAVPLH